MGCAALVVALAEVGKDARPSLGGCQGIQFMIFLLVLPGMCLSSMTKAAAETPHASTRPVLLLLAETTCRKARSGSKSPLQEATNTPLLLEQAFLPKFCACFGRLWLWAPMELSPRQDLAQWRENSAFHFPVLLAQPHSLPVGFG